MWPSNIPIGKKIPTDPNGGVPVNIQDQITSPELRYFAKVLSTFTLASNTIESGILVENLVYTFEASPGHSISIGNEIAFVDNSISRRFHAYVKNVVDNTITVDRPIDYVFDASTTLGAVITKDMRVDGATTKQIFSISGSDIPIDTVGFCLNIISTSEPSDELFGDISALTNGLVFRVFDSYHKVLGVIRNNGMLRDFGATVEYNDKAGGTNWSTTIYLPFKDLWGVAFRIKTNDCLQIIIQDNLISSSLIDLHASIFGHLTQGES